MEPSHESLSESFQLLFLCFSSLFSLSTHCTYPLSFFLAFLEFPSDANSNQKKKEEEENVLLGDPYEMIQCQSVYLANIACCGNKKKNSIRQKINLCSVSKELIVHKPWGIREQFCSRAAYSSKVFFPFLRNKFGWLSQCPALGSLALLERHVCVLCVLCCVCVLLQIVKMKKILMCKNPFLHFLSVG